MEISENAGYVLCQRGETGFKVLKRHIMHQEMLNVMWAPAVPYWSEYKHKPDLCLEKRFEDQILFL